VMVESRRILTRRNEEMAFVTLEDQAGPVEVIVFPRVFERCRGCLTGESILVVEGRNDSSVEEVDALAEAEGDDDGLEREFQAKVIASGVYTLDDWQEQVIQGQKGPGKAGQSLESRRGGSQGPRRKHNGSLLIIDADGLKEEALTKLRDLLRQFPGKVPVLLRFTQPKELYLRLDDQYRVDADRVAEIRQAAENVVGKGKVYQSIG